MRKSHNVLNRILMMGFLVAVIGTTVMADTVAYWRFDDQDDAEIAANIGDGAGGTIAAGVGLPDSDGPVEGSPVTDWRKAAHDWSGNGNHLTTWEYSWAGMNWDSDVPAATVPQTGATNTLSIANAGSYPAAMTWSAASNPAGVDLETWQPSKWSIEASFKTNYTNGNFTFVGRDDRYIGGSNRGAIYFAVRYGGKVDFQFGDADGYYHYVSSAEGVILTNTWYNVAATSDGETLKLYLDGILVDAVDMTVSGSTDTRMGITGNSGGDWHAGTWTVGRGLYAGGHTDRFYGRIDEVRISDKALDLNEFLFPIPPAYQSGTVVPDDLGVNRLPWVNMLTWDQDADAPLGSKEGGSVWGTGAFYSDVQGSVIGGGRDYTALRIDLNAMMGRDVQMGEIESLTYYTNMQAGSGSDWQLKIYTQPLEEQASGWYGHRFNFTRPDNADGNWDRWDTDTYTVEWIRSGEGVNEYPDGLLTDVVDPYATERILFIDLIAGWATNSPEVYSYLDAVTIKLLNGSEVMLDLEESRLPLCSTHSPMHIAETSAMMTGVITDSGGMICEYRFRYTPEGGSEQATPWKKATGSNSIFLTVEGLLDDTFYTYQMEVRNSAGSDLGELRSFTTLQLPQVYLSSSAGGVVAEPGEGLVKLEDQGDVLEVYAIPAEGYLFSQWAGTAVDRGLVADATAAATTVEVYQALTLKALFVPVPKIVWVTEDRDADEDGVRDDVAWVELLEAAGYVVDCQPDRYVNMTGEQDVNDANDYLAELNEATLVIISRAAGSGNYDDNADEIAKWNSVTTPMICLSAYHIRSNCWDWLDSDTAGSDNIMAFMAASDETHPILADVSMFSGAVELVDVATYGDGYLGTTFVMANNVGNGTALGSHLFGYPWIVEWEPGVAYYEGSSQVAGGKRMMFMAGTQESDGIPQGDLNLTPDGQQVFLNAVAYMMAANPIPTDEIFMKHLYTFEDGTPADLVGGADGKLVGDAYVADGSMITVDQDDWMEMPGDVIAINTYHEVTLEMWYTPSEGANTGFTMLAYLGDSVGNYGTDGYFITTARGDDVSRTAISCGSSSPWSAESGVNGPEYDDGLLHHMVSTINDEVISLYIDGVFIGSAELSADNKISNLSNNYAYLAKGGYTGDPEWIGSIHKFAIYNKALTEMEILFLYIQGE